MANFMSTNKRRGPKQRDLSLDSLSYVALGSSKVCVSLPLKLLIGWTDGTVLEAPRLELGRAFVGRMLVSLNEVSYLKVFIREYKREREEKEKKLTIGYCFSGKRLDNNVRLT